MALLSPGAVRWWWLGLWLLLAVYTLDNMTLGTLAREIERNIRVADEAFPDKMTILNQTVTCGSFRPGKFVARTFTCADLRVDGRRLAYGFYSGWAVGDGSMRCKETHGVHEFAELCRLMLEHHDKLSLGFQAVYIPNSTCSFLDEPRKLLKKVSESDFRWTDFDRGWGWTDTLQCMTTAV